ADLAASFWTNDVVLLLVARHGLVRAKREQHEQREDPDLGTGRGLPLSTPYGGELLSKRQLPRPCVRSRPRMTATEAASFGPPPVAEESASAERMERMVEVVVRHLTAEKRAGLDREAVVQASPDAGVVGLRTQVVRGREVPRHREARRPLDVDVELIRA